MIYLSNIIAYIKISIGLKLQGGAKPLRPPLQF